MKIINSDYFEENGFEKKDLVKLEPVGIQISADIQRPMLILKDKLEKYVLPVYLNPLEAGVSLGQGQIQLQTNSGGPHHVTGLIFQSLGLKIEKCIFVEIVNQKQFVRLYFENHPSHGSMKVKAEEAMSLCLHLKVPFYAPKEVVNKAKVMTAEVDLVSKSLNLHPDSLIRHHEYLM